MGKKCQSQTVTLTLIGQCPMSNSSEDFSYPTIYSNFKILDHLFFELSCLHTDRQTHTHTRRQLLYTCGLDRKYNYQLHSIQHKIKTTIQYWYLDVYQYLLCACQRLCMNISPSLHLCDDVKTLAKSGLREEIMVAPLHRSEISPFSGYDLSRDPKHAISLSPSRRPKLQRQDG